ncbi:MAG: NAD(P)/FAD-dependent oxidoreductase [Hyphomicrobium sp.]
MADFDAIAIGGGLAGSAFALELARQGARVAIIERTPQAQLKVCGDFLSAEAQHLLAYLGLDVAGMGATHIEMFRLVTGEQTATATLPFAGAGLSRLTLDEALLGKAQEAGAEIIRGEGVTALEPARARVRVRTAPKSFNAKCAALATGKHNLRGWPRTVGDMTAYKIQLSLSQEASRALEGLVQLVSYRGGYIGACNVEDDTATICWLMDARAMKEVGPEWTAHLDYISRHSSTMGDLLAGARYLSARPAAVSSIPYGYLRRAVIAANVYPTGDQLSVIPSFTGDGTSLALASGLAAARAVLSSQPAQGFQAEFLGRIRTQFFWARAIDATFKSGITRALSVGAMGALPPLATLVASLTRMKGVTEMTTDPTQ